MNTNDEDAILASIRQQSVSTAPPPPISRQSKGIAYDNFTYDVKHKPLPKRSSNETIIKVKSGIKEENYKEGQVFSIISFAPFVIYNEVRGVIEGADPNDFDLES